MFKNRQSKKHLFSFIAFVSLCHLTTFIPKLVALDSEGSLIFDKVHSFALEGNLIEDPAERSVIVYLPPTYETYPMKRYPVVYLLHGYTLTNRVWVSDYSYTGNVAKMMNKLIAEGKAQEMILVMPDANNKYQGSFYTNSSVTGNWEDFITQELVKYIDSNYRTIPQTSSRGIAGHSMGGYGAIKLAMKHPDVYSTVYAMSACCLFRSSEEMNDLIWPVALNLKDVKQFLDANYVVQAKIALSAAFSPNPNNPPFFVDLPFEIVDRDDGELKVIESVWSKWLANMPLVMLNQYRSNLLKLRDIRIDVGNKDINLYQNRAFSQALTAAGVRHVFEEYDGDHLDRIKVRIENKVLPFLSDVLKPQDKLATRWGEMKKSTLMDFRKEK